MPDPIITPSVDDITARNNTLVVLKFNGQKVARVQQFSEDINNNVQVLAELGSAYMVELKKGITSYSFSIARFVCRGDVMDDLKTGRVFGLGVVDTGLEGVPAETLEYFPRCMITSMRRDFTIGQASVGENAQIVTVGKGVQQPTTA